jgi:hypothetical protein
MKKFFLSVLFTVFLIGCSSNSTPSASTLPPVSSQSLLLRPEVSFFYSVDGGRTYSDGNKELPVGEVIYARIYIRINTNNSNSYFVNTDVRIPNVEGIEAFYNSGQVITPDDDKLNNWVTWTATIIASANAAQELLTFKFVPLTPSSQTIFVLFDENVLSLYDKQDTVTFVSPEVEDSSN